MLPKEVHKALTMAMPVGVISSVGQSLVRNGMIVPISMRETAGTGTGIMPC